VAVCYNIRIKNCRLLTGEDFRGKSTSKREYFYGFKVALLIDEHGNPIELAMYTGAYAEQLALHRMNFDLPKGSIVWQDSGFTDYEWEDFYLENEGIEFATQRKTNSLRGDSFIDEMAKKCNRKIVETAYSVITSRFPKRIHAVTIEGFQMKVFFVILAYTIIKYL
jgi:Transposase DDE domain